MVEHQHILFHFLVQNGIRVSNFFLSFFTVTSYPEQYLIHQFSLFHCDILELSSQMCINVVKSSIEAHRVEGVLLLHRVE